MTIINKDKCKDCEHFLEGHAGYELDDVCMIIGSIDLGVKTCPRENAD